MLQKLDDECDANINDTKSFTLPWIHICWRSYFSEVGLTHRCDEAIERLPPLCVFDCDGTEVISEPDGWNDPARVAVSNVFLRGMEEERM